MTLLRPPYTYPLLLAFGLAAAVVHADIVVEDRSLSAPAKPTPVATPAPASIAAETPASPVPVADVKATVTTSAAAETGSSSAWDQFQQMQQLQDELSRLRGTVEEQGHLIEKLQADLRTRYTDLDQRFSTLLEQQRLAQSAAAGTTPATSPAAAASATLEDEKKAYLAAYEVFRAGGPDKAIPPMLAFVKRYPESTFTPGAHYWLGEFYLNASTPDQAAAWKQFETVLNKYPEHAKAPAALYKQASILDLQGKPLEARQKMQDVLNKYPKSPEAGLAESYLKALAEAEAASKAAAKPAKSEAKPATKPAAKSANKDAAKKG